MQGIYAVDTMVYHLQDYLQKWRGEPLLLYLPFQSVHQPVTKLPPYEIPRGCLDPTDLPARTAVYQAMVAGMDAGLKRIFDLLDRHNILEDLVWAAFSDNGGHPEFGGNNSPLRGEKNQVWEGGVHVRALLGGPGFPQQTTYRGLMDVADVFPTLMEAAGLHWSPSKSQTGYSQLAAIQGKQPGRQEVFIALDWCNCPFDYKCAQGPCDCPVKPKDLIRRNLTAAFRSGPWKLTCIWGADCMLFNLDDDIGESNDLAEVHPNISEALFGQLERYFLGAVDSLKSACLQNCVPPNGYQAWVPEDYNGPG
jgi:hypothetical protein